jgi:dihydroflavonol-4-reductase
MSLTVAAEKGRTGENYLLGGHHRSVRDLALAAEEFSGVAPPRYRIPMAVARMLSPLGDLLVRRTGNPLWYTRESLHALTHSPQVSSRKAAEELGHRPRPVEETIGDIYDWFSENDLLG